MLSIREELYEYSENDFTGLEKEDIINAVADIIIKRIGKNREIKVPIQLFEKLFDFDVHRGAKHWISSFIVRNFKKKGLKISKVRNKYQVRIKKI